MRVRVLATVLVALVVSSSVSLVSASAQSELEQARQRARSAAEAADRARESSDAARARVNESLRAIEDANGALAAVDLEVDRLEREVEAIQVEVARLEAEIMTLAVERYVRREGSADGIVETDDVLGALRDDVLLDFAILGGRVDVDEYRVATEDLGRATTALEQQRVEQAAVLDQLRAHHEGVAAELAILEENLVEAERQEAVFVQEVAKLEEEERRRLEAERERQRQEQLARQEAERQRQLQEQAERNAQEDQGGGDDGDPDPPPPPVVGDGAMLCPIAGATTFVDTWGAPRSGGRRHKGVDMFASRGTPVVAVVSGTVRQSSSGLGGLGFWLHGDNGNRYFGSHLDSFAVSGRVAAGTVIGTVGNTGNARWSSPHLHFEIHPGGGAAANPYPATARACGV